MNDEMTGSLEPTNHQLDSHLKSVASYLIWSERRTDIAKSRVQSPLTFPVEVLNFSGFHPQLQKLRS